MPSHLDKPKQRVITTSSAKGKRTAVVVLGDAQRGQRRLCYADRVYKISAEPECEDLGISQSRRRCLSCVPGWQGHWQGEGGMTQQRDSQRELKEEAQIRCPWLGGWQGCCWKQKVEVSGRSWAGNDPEHAEGHPARHARDLQRSIKNDLDIFIMKSPGNYSHLNKWRDIDLQVWYNSRVLNTTIHMYVIFIYNTHLCHTWQMYKYTI